MKDEIFEDTSIGYGKEYGVSTTLGLDTSISDSGKEWEALSFPEWYQDGISEVLLVLESKHGLGSRTIAFCDEDEDGFYGCTESDIFIWQGEAILYPRSIWECVEIREYNHYTDFLNAKWWNKKANMFLTKIEMIERGA